MSDLGRAVSAYISGLIMLGMAGGILLAIIVPFLWNHIHISFIWGSP